jgi:hypothetical protein
MITFKDEYTLGEADELTNDIHPLFAEERFPAHIDYNAIAPSLRLATRLLATEAFAEFVVTMLDGKLVATNGRKIRREDLMLAQILKYNNYGDYKDLKVRCLPRTNDTPSHIISERARTILEQMIHMVTFNWDEESETCFTFSVSGPLPKWLHMSFPHGTSSLINIQLPLYNLLSDYTKRCPDLTASEQRDFLASRYLLANHFIHEMAHSIHMAAFGATPDEVFYKTVPMNECGFTAIAEISGCLPEVIAHDHMVHPQWFQRFCKAPPKHEVGTFVMWLPWPSPSRYMQYKEGGHPIDYATKALPVLEHRGRVPMQYLAHLFTTSFWENQVAREPRKALRAPKIGRWPYKNNGGRVVNVPYKVLCRMFGPHRAHRMAPCAEDGEQRCADNPWSIDAEDVLATCCTEVWTRSDPESYIVAVG